MSDRNPLPKKLQEDMKNVSRYKPEPFNIENVLDTGVENALFDEVFGSVVKKSDRKESSETKSSDFTTVLASKLVDTEKENKALRNRLAMSNMKITRLEETIDELRDIVKTQISSENLEAIQHIRHDNTRLQRQLMEMEQFLADYGLNWVGYQDVPDGEEGGEITTKKEEEEKTEMHGFDIFKKRIDELNSLISEEPAKVVTSSHGGGVKARFAHMSGEKYSFSSSHSTRACTLSEAVCCHFTSYLHTHSFAPPLPPSIIPQICGNSCASHLSLPLLIVM